MKKLILACTLATAVTAQQELWVEPAAGLDTNPGTYTQPLRTLTTAVGLAGVGDRIHLLAGTYGPTQNGEVFPIRLGTNAQTGLVVRGIGNVVFDLGGSAQTVFTLAQGASGARITNLTIQNTDQAGWWTRVINSGSGVNSASPALNVEIDRCRFVNCNRVFVLWTADNVTGWQVHDNLFVNCGNDAILEYTGTNDFYNNTFHTGAFKAYISDSTTSRCHNNLIVAYATGLENNSSGAPLGRYQGNWLYQCTVPLSGVGMAGTLPVSNRIGTNPLLSNPAAGDYHVQANSPTIDAGVLGTFARADLDANSRLVDGNVDGVLQADVGCYERSPVHLSVNWDVQNRLMWIDGTSTIPGTFGFVLFSFDDGIATFPGQGPILVDQASFVPFFLSAPLPQQWVLSFNSYVWPPGQRLVMQILGIGPNHVGSALFGGNQVWVQF